MKTYKVSFIEQKQIVGTREERHKSARCILPIAALNEIGVDESNRYVDIDIDNDKIVITRSALND